MTKTEKQIHRIIDAHYHGVEKDIKQWYNTKNYFLGKRTPKELIENGEEMKVLEFLKMVKR